MPSSRPQSVCFIAPTRPLPPPSSRSHHRHRHLSRPAFRPCLLPPRHATLRHANIPRPRHTPCATASSPTTSTPSLPLQAGHVILSLASLFALQTLCKSLLSHLSLVFPPPLFAMLSLLCAISLLRLLRLNAIADRTIALVFTPAASFLTRWLAVFFVPNLVMLPLAPALPARDFYTIAAMLVLGFLFTLATSALVGVFLRFVVRTLTNTAPKQVTSPPPSSTPPSNALIFFTAATTVASLLLSLAPAAAIPLPAYATKLYALSATILSFCVGQRFPRPVKRILHPLVSCTLGTIALMYLHAVVTGVPFAAALAAYYIRSAGGWGGGNLLAALLGPAVITFALTVDRYRLLAIKRSVEVVGVSLFSTVASLFATAFAAKSLKLSASSRLIMLPRTVTAPLAVPIAAMLDANLALAASVVALTGLLAANLAATILTACNVNDPVIRGLAVGSSGHGLGTAAVSDEGATFAFSALAMTLVGVFSTVLVAYAPFRSLLIRVALGMCTAAS